ncbi:GSCOCT00014175001.2-RA-CDS [Cotesia congregata]|uniref:Venom protein 16 n=1 Tax=Cotesia congregata TaxID=51543 RepID=A0A8J2HD75_COTCN|nr:GSCOCT00014175001.2-RA-CDS [Cotesia congregata]CAG5094906.1 Putative venom protein 16 [Cotesia congregata]
MKLSKVSVCFVLKIFIIISMKVEESITDLINLSQTDDWKLLNSLASEGHSASGVMQKKILKKALPIIAKNYFTMKLILESVVVDSAVMEYSNEPENNSYFFVKAVIGETYCPDTENVNYDVDHNNEECFKQSMAVPLKLCTIHIFYEPLTEKFGDNAIKCWEMKNVDVNDDFFNYQVLKVAETEINKQVPHSDDTLLVVIESERASDIFLNNSEIWYNKIFYLKLQVESCLKVDYKRDGYCFSPDEQDRSLICSGEIDFASEKSNLYKDYTFNCE